MAGYRGHFRDGRVEILPGEKYGLWGTSLAEDFLEHLVASDNPVAFYRGKPRKKKYYIRQTGEWY
jgi:hypothetical protein